MKKIQKISEAGLNKIVEYEGMRLEAYKDPVGYLTIGVGHLLTKSELAEGILRIGEHNVDWTTGLTELDCLRLLDQDCDVAENAVNRLVTRKLTQSQFDSLVSFIFNVGVNAFQKSTLLKVLNANGKSDEIQREFKRWNKAGGKVLAGLVNRRQREAEAFYEE